MSTSKLINLEHNQIKSTWNNNSIVKKSSPKIFCLIQLNEHLIISGHDKGIICGWVIGEDKLNLSTCAFTLNAHTNYQIYAVEKVSDISFVSGEWSKLGNIILWEIPENDEIGKVSSSKSFSLPTESKRIKLKEGVSVIKMVFSNLLACGMIDGTIIFWDTHTNQIRMQFEKHTAETRCLLTLCKSKYLLSGSRDKKFYIWNIEQRGLNSFQFNQEHKGWVNCMCELDKNTKFATAGGDTSDPVIRIWEVGNKSSIKSLYIHSEVITSLWFENGFLFSSSHDMTIKRCNPYEHLENEIEKYNTDVMPDRLLYIQKFSCFAYIAWKNSQIYIIYRIIK